MALRDAPIIIKKIKKGGGGGHHGGAWKVAYADFVTAMMAFFLLMWLINTTSPEQKRGIADYFAPASVSQTTSGSGGILGGTSIGKDGGKSDGTVTAIEQRSPDVQADAQKTEKANLTGASEDELRKELRKREAADFESAAESIKQALQEMPELADLSKNIIVDQTPEGLRIQLIDQEGRSMFDPGKTQPNDRAKLLLRAVAKVINPLPNRITVTGHTSASADHSKPETDWPLSTGRADGSRQVLVASGVDKDRVYQVSGKAASEPLYPDDPTLPGNRRIAIILLREAPVLPTETSP